MFQPFPSSQSHSGPSIHPSIQPTSLQSKLTPEQAPSLSSYRPTTQLSYPFPTQRPTHPLLTHSPPPDDKKRYCVSLMAKGKPRIDTSESARQALWHWGFGEPVDICRVWFGEMVVVVVFSGTRSGRGPAGGRSDYAHVICRIREY